LERRLIETMSLYAVKRGCGDAETAGGAPRRRFGERPILFELTPREAIDVNVMSDLELSEQVCAGERSAHNQRLSAMAPYLSSAIFADLASERGMDVALPSEIRPISAGKFLGRAKTLALEAVTDGHWRGIYDALDSYDFARPGDVIVVANDVPGRAYFGELNASLARRAGAVGVVIDGMTRDTPAVEQLSIPVYAHGSHPRDIKHEGTVKSMNRPVPIGDVEVRNGDYVLADSDGVVVIPSHEWERFCEEAWEVAEREWDIRRAVARGERPAEIMRRFGAF
jgi:regulator of RNase E activity RraA